MQQSNQNIVNQQPARQIMHRICQQIQQQIQAFLSTPSSEAPSQLPKNLQKHINSSKQSLIRIISSRIPQIIAIEQKYKTIVLQINDQLQLQKEKCKEIYVRYEQKILECDRYKMETVQIGEMYDAVQRENSDLRRCRDGKFEQICTQTQIQSKQNIDYINQDKINQQVMQLQEQIQLYKTEITDYTVQIKQMQNNEHTANQRIQNLLQQIKEYRQKIEEKEQSSQMLKSEIKKLVIQIQQNKMLFQEATCAYTQQKLKYQSVYELQKEKFQQLLSKNYVVIQQLNAKQAQCIRKIKQLQHTIRSKEQELIKKNQEHMLTIKQNIHRQQQLKDKIRYIKQLQQRVNKINSIIQAQQTLKQKYTKKQELLSKQLKQLSSKNTFYAQQNQRLYQAMQQYAKKQHKLTNQLTQNQLSIHKQRQQINKHIEFRDSMKHWIGGVRKELRELRAALAGYGSIGDFIQVFKGELEGIVREYEGRWSRKLLEISDARAKQKGEQTKKLQIIQMQYKNLQQKIIQSQINSNKVANSLVQSKNELYNKLLQKQQIIRSLQTQLCKQKQFNEMSTLRLHEVVKKYDKVLSFYNSNSNANGNGHYQPRGTGNRNVGEIYRVGRNGVADMDAFVEDLEGKLEQQRNRLRELEIEYKSVLKS